MFYVYIIQSIRTQKTYVGSTEVRPLERLCQHNEGKSRWTNMYKPWRLIYYESYYCRRDALHRENFLKSGQGNKLVAIIKKYFR